MRAAETVLVDDQFTDLERASQTLPVSMRWNYLGATSASSRFNVVPVVDGRWLQLNGLGTAMMVNSYFTASGSPRSLNVGDSIRLSFQMTVTATPPTPEGLRIGLYNSYGVRPTGDVAATSVLDASTYGGYSGYGIYFNPVNPLPSGTINLNIVRKSRTDNFGIPAITSGPILNAGSNAVSTPLGLSANVPFPVVFTVTRTSATQVTISASINGRTATATDSSTAFTTGFDTISIFSSSAALPNGQHLRYDDVQVVYTPAGGSPVTDLNDTFSDDERITLNPPASARWLTRIQNASANPTTTLSVPTAGQSNTNRDLIYRSHASGLTSVAHFTNSGALSLADGEAIVARVSLRPGSAPLNAPRGIRLGLFNSQGSRIASDYETGVTSPPAGTFEGYRGYTVEFNGGSGAAGTTVIGKRATSAATLFDTSAYSVIGTSASSGASLSVPYWARVSLRVMRVGERMRIDASVQDAWVTVADVAPETFAFDTLALHVAGNALPAEANLRIEDVFVVRSLSDLANVTNPSVILTENFNLAGWPGASAVGTGGATGSVSYGEFGTYDGFGSLVRSGALRLAADSTQASVPWSVRLDSAPLIVSNPETNLAKLTFACDLAASTTAPVKVILSSLDSNGATTGSLAKLVYPAAAATTQRFSFELSEMTSVSGTFDPHATSLRVSFAIEGGAPGLSSWIAGSHTLDVDNVYLARPAYYVSPTGSNSNNGRSEADQGGGVGPFLTLERALQFAAAGDIVLVRGNGSSTGIPDYTGLYASDPNNGGIEINVQGRPAAWFTVKGYPGERPLFFNRGWGILKVGRGGPNARNRDRNPSFIELRGLAVTSKADELWAQGNVGGTATPAASTGGVAIDGRYMALRPYRIRVADVLAYQISGGGIWAIQAGDIVFENNIAHHTSYLSIYANSGLHILFPFDYAGRPQEYRTLFLNNEAYENRSSFPWPAIGRISDGNGIIIDSTFNNHPDAPAEGATTHRTLVQGNLLHRNGGSGAHPYASHRVDFINNTAYHNTQVLNYGELYSADSDDIRFINNIMVSRPTLTGEEPRDLNPVGPKTLVTGNVGVFFYNNVYQVGTGSASPVNGTASANNVVTTERIFVDPSPGVRDFRLGAGSPAVDKGQLNPSVARVDFLGYPRGTDGTVDAGAFERQPIILTQPPATLAADLGQTVVLTVGALGDDVTYQWQKDTVAIAGQTGPSLTLTPVSPADAGSYRVVVSTPFDSLTSNATALTVYSAVEVWRRGFFGTTANAGTAADTADPDGDGVANLLEYALGLDPTKSDAAGAINSGSITMGSDRYLTLTFRRKAGTDTVPVLVQASGNLSDWTDLPVPGANVVSETGTDPKTYVVRDAVPLGSGPNRRYLRLAVAGAGVVDSPVVGSLQSLALPNSDTLVSAPVHQEPAYVGKVASVTGTVIAVTGTPAWAAGAYAVDAGVVLHYVRMRSGALAGHYFTVTTNAAASLTVDPAGLDLSGIAAGDALELVPYWTLGTLYPSGQAGVSYVASPSSLTPGTQLLMPDQTRTGINRAASDTYLYLNGAWRRIGSRATQSFDRTPIPPDVYLVHRNRAQATLVTRTGFVPAGPVSTVLATAATANDNYVALAWPEPVTLAQSDLISSGAFAAGDQLLTYASGQSGINRTPNATYTYENGAWRKVGAPASESYDAVILVPGEGFILRKAAGASPSVWRFTP